jgi:hypothetical protein
MCHTPASIGGPLSNEKSSGGEGRLWVRMERHCFVLGPKVLKNISKMTMISRNVQSAKKKEKGEERKRKGKYEPAPVESSRLSKPVSFSRKAVMLNQQKKVYPTLLEGNRSKFVEM